MKVPVVHGERVTLRPWRTEDADWYVAARDDLVLRYTTERLDLERGDVVEAIERASASDEAAAFAIVDERGELVGNLAIDLTTDVGGSTAELSYFLAPAGRGRGLATDAVRAAVGWLRGRDVQRVHAVTMAGNDSSAAVLTRAGFAPTGEVDHPRLGAGTLWELRSED